MNIKPLSVLVLMYSCYNQYLRIYVAHSKVWRFTTPPLPSRFPPLNIIMSDVCKEHSMYILCVQEIDPSIACIEVIVRQKSGPLIWRVDSDTSRASVS